VGVPRDHREQAGGGDGCLEVGDEDLDVDLLTAEVAVHQGLILGPLDDRLDQLAAGGVDHHGLVIVRRALTPGAGLGPVGVVEDLL
jgi:hypothetical protein